LPQRDPTLNHCLPPLHLYLCCLDHGYVSQGSRKSCPKYSEIFKHPRCTTIRERFGLLLVYGLTLLQVQCEIWRQIPERERERGNLEVVLPWLAPSGRWGVWPTTCWGWGAWPCGLLEMGILVRFLAWPVTSWGWGLATWWRWWPRPYCALPH
jgi:hypothetical protein